ncbi:hypothetical protein EIP86_007709 [Pleurotus ostreatoroseus]|nr:hypothetical protein EIP86_007709 [Pleurotus ostreatoroseus]
MAPAEKNHTHSRYEPYDAASSHHKAKLADSSVAATEPTAYDVDTTVSTVINVHNIKVVESTEVDNSVESKTTLITQEVVTVDSDTESEDSDVVEIENPALATAHREIIEVDLIGEEDEEEGIEGAQNNEEYSEEDEEEEGEEDDDEEDVDETRAEVGGDWDGDDRYEFEDKNVHTAELYYASEMWGPKIPLEEELDLIEQSMAGYDPEADPEYHEMKRKLEDEGWFDAPDEDFDEDFYTHRW